MSDTTFYGLEHKIDGVPIGDLTVLGRKVREYSPTEFTSRQECDAFTTALYEQVPVGDDLCHVIGQDFHDAFYARRTAFIRDEEAKAAIDRTHERIRRVIGPDERYELLATFVVGHVGWEMDNNYAVFRHDGAIKYLGTDHGNPVVFDRAHIEGLLAEAEGRVAGIRDALSKT